MENFWRLSMKKEDAFLNIFFLPWFHMKVKIKFSPFLSIFFLGLSFTIDSKRFSVMLR